MKLAIERVDGKQWTYFHLSEPVPVVGLLSKNENKEFKSKLMAVKGVKDIHSWDYAVRIERAACFTWDELEPQIIEVLRKHFGVEKFETVQPFA